jgi:hypothetical protein
MDRRGFLGLLSSLGAALAVSPGALLEERKRLNGEIIDPSPDTTYALASVEDVEPYTPVPNAKLLESGVRLWLDGHEVADVTYVELNRDVRETTGLGDAWQTWEPTNTMCLRWRGFTVRDFWPVFDKVQLVRFEIRHSGQVERWEGDAYLTEYTRHHELHALTRSEGKLLFTGEVRKCGGVTSSRS